MKKTFTFCKDLALYLIASMALLTSCSKDYTETPSGSYDLSINVSSLPFDASSDLSHQIVLTAGNQWSLLNDSDDAPYAYADWVSDVYPKSGGSGDNTVTITLDDNWSLTPRYTTLYFGIKMDDGNYKLAELKIEQSASEGGVFTIDRNDVWFSAHYDNTSDYTVSVNITSDYSWKVLNNGGDENYENYDWITFNTAESTGSGELTFTVSPYDEASYSDRSALIYIQYDAPDAEPVYMNISQFSQYSSHISSKQASFGVLSVDQAGTPIEFSIISSHPWAISESDPAGLTGALEWVGLSPMSGICNDTVILDCEPNNTGNTRTSHIYTMLPSVSNDWLYHSFTVEQAGYEGLEFSLSYDSAYGDSTTNSVSIPSDGSGVVASVKSSSDWKIDSSSPHYTDGNGWLKASISEGSNGDLITFTSNSENTDFTNRETQVYFTMDAYPNMEPVVYSVTQSSSSLNNAEITLSCPSIEYANNAIALSVICESNSALTYNVTVDADLPWEITEAAASWVKTSVSGDRITVTIKNNGFNSGRETVICLRQKYDDVYYGKEQAIVISQAAKATAILDTYRDLGYGYDISGLYAHKDYIKKQVLDWDKLNSYDIIDDVTYYGTSVKYVTSTYTTMSEAQDSLCLTAGVNIKYNGFTTEVNGSYESSYLSYEESEFGETKATVNLAKLSTSYNVNSESDLSNLRSCLKDDVYAAINSLEKIEDAKKFIETYGAYVMMGCTYGGTYKYTISAIRNKTSSSYDWSTAVSAGYEDATGLNTGLVSAGVSETFSMANETYTYETEATINGGGGSLKDADAWLASLTTDVTTASVYMSLIDFGGVNMIAISELAEEKSVRDLLAQAIEELTQNNAVETVTASQSVFSYEFWIGEIFYYSDDVGSTAEVKFDIDAKIIDSSSNSWTSMKGNWTDMWSSNDLGDDTYISVPNNGEYATVLEMGIGTTTATNKFSTGSIFTGGAGSYVIGFKIYAVEDDSSSGDDDASTTYAYFQTKTGYLGSRIDEKPFYYVYSVDDMAYPQEVIQGYVDKHTLSWTSVAESLGNGDLRNGYAIVEGVNSISEHKWRFTIYYRML